MSRPARVAIAIAITTLAAMILYLVFLRDPGMALGAVDVVEWSG
jgi:hypothetical protein